MKKKEHDGYSLIGGHIRKWRNIKGIKQVHLARSLGISVAAMSYLENDITIPNLHKLEDISRAFDISIDMLIAGPEQIIQKRSV